jgi:hypothetical protein
METPMAQLEQDEWPQDQEPTTEETQVEIAERDVRGSKGDPLGGDVKNNHPGGEPGDDLLNVDIDSAID